MVNDRSEYCKDCFDVPDFLHFKSVRYMDEETKQDIPNN